MYIVKYIWGNYENLANLETHVPDNIVTVYDCSKGVMIEKTASELMNLFVTGEVYPADEVQFGLMMDLYYCLIMVDRNYFHVLYKGKYYMYTNETSAVVGDVKVERHLLRIILSGFMAVSITIDLSKDSIPDMHGIPMTEVEFKRMLLFR